MSDSPIRAVLSAIDTLDLDAVMSLFAPEPTLTTVVGDDAEGRERARDELAKLFSELRATEHRVTAEWNPEPGVWVAEVEATYELTDFSRRGPYERAFIVKAGDDGVEEMRIYGQQELPLAESGHPYRDVYGPHGWLPTL